MNSEVERQVLLFDGVCNLCNGTVDFVIRRDPRGKYAFAPLQSDVARRLLAEHDLDGLGVTTIVLIDRDGVHWESEAVLRVAQGLGFPWNLAAAGRIVPRSLRDGIYRWIARNRYRWFGKRNTCRVPTEEERERFLADP